MARLKKQLALRLSLAGTAALAGLGLGGCGKSSGPSATAPSSATRNQSRGQPLLFVGDIRHGPSAGLSVFGIIALKLGRSGQLTGSVLHHGERLPVSGTAHGRTLTLVFHLPDGLKVSGVGKAAREIRSIAEIPTKGTLTGPHPGDRGDWDLIIGGTHHVAGAA